MDMHMDGAWDTFWIKSRSGTFIALQMKSFGPKKFQISSTGKKVPFWQFFRMGWGGCGLLVQRESLARIPPKTKILFVLLNVEPPKNCLKWVQIWHFWRSRLYAIVLSAKSLKCHISALCHRAHFSKWRSKTITSLWKCHVTIKVLMTCFHEFFLVIFSYCLNINCRL